MLISNIKTVWFTIYTEYLHVSIFTFQNLVLTDE